jgi:hypothetical protein
MERGTVWCAYVAPMVEGDKLHCFWPLWSCCVVQVVACEFVVLMMFVMFVKGVVPSLFFSFLNMKHTRHNLENHTTAARGFLHVEYNLCMPRIQRDMM